ncbi:DNA-binding domain-containing protein, AraC-type [Opitutaceae bacterium TAV1]|nr:DNA-binding domain-containing protein, AraC-type [Opitutaceae bacterium TAV1]
MSPFVKASDSRFLFALIDSRMMAEKDGRNAKTGFAFSPVAGRVRQVIWLEGHGTIEMERSRDVLAAGTVVTLPENSVAGVKIREQRGGGVSARACAMELVWGEGLAGGYADFLAKTFGKIVHLPGRSPVLRIARELAQSIHAGGRRGVEADSMKFFSWFLHLHLALLRLQPHVDELAEGRLETLFQEGERHGYSIKGLAACLGCKTAFLEKRLRQAWDAPVGRVLRELRVCHASRLLAETRLPLEHVARQCGFASVPSFSFAFKRGSGLTPAEARAKKFCHPSPLPLSGVPAHTKISSILTDTKSKKSAMAWAYASSMPVVVWTGPYFQFDGGVITGTYKAPFELALNAVTDSVNWILTLKGEAVFEVAGRKLHVEPGMVLVYPQPLNARWTTPSGHPWQRIWVAMRGEWATEAMLALADEHGWAHRIPLGSRVARLARKWLPGWVQHRHEFLPETSVAAYEWLLSWRGLLQGGNLKRRGEAVVERIEMPNLRDFGSRSFFRRIKSIRSYAEEIGYSRSHLSRKLRQQWGKGHRMPGQVIRAQRLNQAAVELRQTRLSVEEIAQRAQFASAKCFIPAFKREFGMTPLAWRFAHGQTFFA